MLVVDNPRFGAGAAVKSAFLEGRLASLAIVTIDDGCATTPELIDSVSADALLTGFHALAYRGEARFEQRGILQDITEIPDARVKYLGADDLIVATGGGKGITAECALQIAASSGAKLVLFGRAAAEDPEVPGTLERAQRMRLQCTYRSCDVTDADAMARVLDQLQSELGPITAILHGAGRNEPKNSLELTAADLVSTLDPKVVGLRNILERIDISRLRLLLGFGSIIGRAGLHGEAHYALANDWLSDLIGQYGEQHPHLRARTIEWSVWADAGMGERLGVVETLRQQGIEPIPAHAGVDVCLQAINAQDLPTRFVVSGRTGNLPTLPLRQADTPFLRFIDDVKAFYEGVELVVDNQLSLGTDPYLGDHMLDGDLLFPAVMGMEAMAQAARCLDPGLTHLRLDDVQFNRPIVVPVDGTETLRVAALKTADGVVVVLRCASTDFAVDHFRATVRSRAVTLRSATKRISQRLHDEPGCSSARAQQFYELVMFQGPRFQKLCGYERAGAREAVASVDPRDSTDWFAPYLPQTLVLADPGARDVMMHALQCCIPDAVLLPGAIAHLDLASREDGAHTKGPWVLEGQETRHDGDMYEYTVTAYTPDGHVVEQWQGLRLHAVRRRSVADLTLPPLFLAPFIQRTSERLQLAGIRALASVHESHTGSEPTPINRRAHSDAVLSQLLPSSTVGRTSDGRIVVEGNAHVSTAHEPRYTLALVSDHAIACDVEPADPRSAEAWQQLLGKHWPVATRLAEEANEDLDSAATRVWGAMECVRKLGLRDASLTLAQSPHDDVVTIHAGTQTVHSWVIRVGDGSPTVISLTGEGQAAA